MWFHKLLLEMILARLGDGWWSMSLVRICRCIKLCFKTFPSGFCSQWKTLVSCWCKFEIFEKKFFELLVMKVDGKNETITRSSTLSNQNPLFSVLNTAEWHTVCGIQYASYTIESILGRSLLTTSILCNYLKLNNVSRWLIWKMLSVELLIWDVKWLSEESILNLPMDHLLLVTMVHLLALLSSMQNINTFHINR